MATFCPCILKKLHALAMFKHARQLLTVYYFNVSKNT